MPVRLDRLTQPTTQKGAGSIEAADISATPQTFNEFGEAAVKDVQGMWEGVTNLPTLAKNLVTHPIDTGEQIVSGVYHQIRDTLTDPVGHFLRQPVSTVLDLATVGGLVRGAAVRAGMAAAETSPRLAKLLRVRALTEAEKVSREALFVRHGEIAARTWEAGLKSKALQEKFAAPVLEDMTFYAEKTRNAKLGVADSFDAVKERLSKVPGALEAADNLAKERQLFWEEANASGMTKEMGFLENYISHFWDVSEGQAKTAASKFALRNPHAAKRIVMTYEDGIAMGLKPKTLDAAELTRMYETNLIRVTENNRMINTLKDLEVEPGLKAIISGGERIPSGYVGISHRALGPTGGFVHPEVAPVLKAVLDKPFDGNFARRLSALNAITKKMALSFSFFHHIALTEAAFGALGFKGLSMLKSGGFRKGLELIKDEAATSEALRAGLNLGALTDVQAGLVSKSLQRIETGLRNTPILGTAAKGVRKFNEVWDKALWDKYHTGLKSYAFHDLYAKALRKSPGVAKEVVAREVAGFVNDAFGGQTWELMVKSPKWQQMAHWVLLAPDWTISNARIAMRPFGSGVTAKLGREYWRRTALASMSGTAVLNYAMTKYYDGRGRFPWENEPGQKLFRVMIGRDEKGRRQYVNFGKQLQEPLRWIYEPLTQFAAKLSPAIQMATEQLTGSSTTGYPMDFKDQEGGEELTGRIKAVVEKTVPISFGGGNVGFSLPRSSGTTGYKVVAGLKRSLREKDNRAMMEWLKAASDNGYNARQLLGIAKRELAIEAKK